MWFTMSVWVRAYLAVGVEAVPALLYKDVSAAEGGTGGRVSDSAILPLHVATRPRRPARLPDGERRPFFPGRVAGADGEGRAQARRGRAGPPRLPGDGAAARPSLLARGGDGGDRRSRPGGAVRLAVHPRPQAERLRDPRPPARALPAGVRDRSHPARLGGTPAPGPGALLRRPALLRRQPGDRLRLGRHQDGRALRLVRRAGAQDRPRFGLASRRIFSSSR